MWLTNFVLLIWYSFTKSVLQRFELFWAQKFYLKIKKAQNLTAQYKLSYKIFKKSSHWVYLDANIKRISPATLPNRHYATEHGKWIWKYFSHNYKSWRWCKVTNSLVLKKTWEEKIVYLVYQNNFYLDTIHSFFLQKRKFFYLSSNFKKSQFELYNCIWKLW